MMKRACCCALGHWKPKHLRILQRGLDWHRVSCGATLIYEGFVEEGLTIVRLCRTTMMDTVAIPWNEVECGHHYTQVLGQLGVT